MEANAIDDLADNLLYLHRKHKDNLASIRHWEKLLVAIDGDYLWVKGFSRDQFESVLCRSIPFAEYFTLKDELLFPPGKLLPVARMKQLFWDPIEKVIEVSLPDFNHNFFGVRQHVTVRLITSEVERKPAGMLIDIHLLESYINQASAVRLKSLTWCVVDGKTAFVLGYPLLPLNGSLYWAERDLFFPGGFELEFAIAADVIALKVNPERAFFLLFRNSGACLKIPKNYLVPLSISSFRATISLPYLQ